MRARGAQGPAASHLTHPAHCQLCPAAKGHRSPLSWDIWARACLAKQCRVSPRHMWCPSQQGYGASHSQGNAAPGALGAAVGTSAAPGRLQRRSPAWSQD